MPTLHTDGRVARLGAIPTEEEASILGRAPSAADIWETMPELNQEVEETYKEEVIDTSAVDRERLRTIKEAEEKAPLKKKAAAQSQVERKLTPDRGRSKETNTPQKTNKVVYREKASVAPKQETNMSLEAELNKLDERTSAQAEPQLSPEEEAEQSRQNIMQLIATFPNAPSEAHINAWKRECGEDGIHITIFSKKEIYIYTHLTRSMWTKVQEIMQKLQSQKNVVGEEELRETVVKHCMKWPILTPEWKYHSRAGVVDALFQAIMFHSYFLTPQQIMAITTEL